MIIIFKLCVPTTQFFVNLGVDIKSIVAYLFNLCSCMPWLSPVISMGSVPPWMLYHSIPPQSWLCFTHNQYNLTTKHSHLATMHHSCCIMYVSMYVGRLSSSCYLPARLGRRNRCIGEERGWCQRSQQG